MQASHLHVYQSLLAQIDRSLALQVKPAEIECYADHRIAMSFAVLGCAVPGVTIKDPACTAKTYPKFFEDLEEMRGKVGARKASEEGGSEQEKQEVVLWYQADTLREWESFSDLFDLWHEPWRSSFLGVHRIW